MSTEHLSNGNHEDKDITDVITLVKRTFYWFLSHFFKGIDFCFKYWWVILILIASGISLALFSGSSTSYNSSLIVQTNFGSQPYVYNAIDQINQNLREGDKKFIKELGLEADSFNIKSLEIEPIVDIVNVMAKIQLSDRSLSTIFGELNQKGDQELFSTELFNQNYKYHKLELTLSSNESEKSLESVIEFINNQPYAKELKEQSIINLEERISENDRTLEQINEVINVYSKSMEFTSSSSDKMAFYNNQSNLSMQEVFEFKADLGKENEYLKNGRVGQSDLVVIVSSPETALDNSIFSKKSFVYPSLLVFLFLLVAFIRYTYTSLKKRLENSNK